MRVSEIMTSPVVTVPWDAPLDQVARTMLERGIGSVVVVDGEDCAAGILTERDFTARDPGNPFDPQRAPVLFGKSVRKHGMEALYQEARTLPARKLMRPIPASLGERDAVEKAMDLMVRHEVHHLPVLRGGRPVGMVSRHDLLRMAVAEPWPPKQEAGQERERRERMAAA